MKNNYYVYMYYDESKIINLDVEFISLKYKPLYIGKGKDNRFKHSTKFLNKTPNIKVKKIIENLNNNQACFIEAYIIDIIGLKNLYNKLSGSKLYLLDEINDNSVCEYIQLLGSY